LKPIVSFTLRLLYVYFTLKPIVSFTLRLLYVYFTLKPIVSFFYKAYCPPSIHLSFDQYAQSTLQDDSGNENNGLLANGAQIVPHGGKCGNAANLLGTLKRSKYIF